jgi:hypothetical protein
MIWAEINSVQITHIQILRFNMTVLYEIVNTLLLEQDSKLEIIRKAIMERIPLSIYYRGPANEVREGQRIDIEPIVLGKHAKSGNLVIWAYVFKGISKRGLPGWKMFRLDRINSAKLNFNVKDFKLDSLPGYERGKAPDAMKSLSSVEIFSPYWFEDQERLKVKPEIPPVKPEAVPPAERTIVKPEISSKESLRKIYNDLRDKTRDVNGQNIISTNDYQNALNNLSHAKEDEFKIYQRAISGNIRPGEGTRKRFTDTSKAEIDNLLSKDNIQISNNPETLAEGYRIQKRIKRLINW